MIVFILLAPILAILIYYLIDKHIKWRVHIDQTKSFCIKDWHWGTFEGFKKEFDKVDWVYRRPYSNSLFITDDVRYEKGNSQIHAGIFTFNGVSLAFQYFDYHKAVQYAKKYMKTMEEPNDCW